MRTDDFEHLYRREAGPLYGFLVYRTGDRDLAEDLLADAFERALSARRRFDPRRGSQRTWLYTIALNCLRDWKRRAAAERRALELTIAAGLDSVATLDWVHEKDALAVALALLSDEERQAIALRYGADLTLRQIAAVIGEPRTTVEGRVYRGLARLRDELRAGDDVAAATQADTKEPLRIGKGSL